MDARSPGPQYAQHKTMFTDLPNEIVAQICEHLVPDRSEPRPFRSNEVRTLLDEAAPDGTHDVHLAAAVDEADRRTRSRQFGEYFRRYSGHRVERGVAVHIQDPLWTEERSQSLGNATSSDGVGSYSQTSNSLKLSETGCSICTLCSQIDAPNHTTRSGNSLTNFAIACRSVADQGRLLHRRHKFHMTISNHGVTFEGLRSGAPLKNGRAMPITKSLDARGSKHQTWTLLDIIHLRYIEIPPASIPGNIAFDGLCGVIKDLRKLSIHVELDMDRADVRRLLFFLDQIVLFLLSQHPGEFHLTTLEVDVKLGFHAHAARLRDADFRHTQLAVPLQIVQDAYDTRQSSTINAIADVALTHAGEILESLATSLYELLVRHNSFVRSDVSTNVSTSAPLQLKFRLLGDGPAMQWSEIVSLAPLYRYAPLVVQWMDFGSFKGFCMAVERDFFRSKGLDAVFDIDENGLICDIHFAVPEKETLLEVGNPVNG